MMIYSIISYYSSTRCCWCHQMIFCRKMRRQCPSVIYQRFTHFPFLLCVQAGKLRVVLEFTVRQLKDNSIKWLTYVFQKQVVFQICFAKISGQVNQCYGHLNFVFFFPALMHTMDTASSVLKITQQIFNHGLLSASVYRISVTFSDNSR